MEISKGYKEEAPFSNSFYRSGKAFSLFVPPFLTCIVLLTIYLSTVAGLFRDEAAFGLFAEEILNGLRPLHGLLSPYTAPLHTYFIAISFSIFGESIWSLRFVGVIFNLIAVILYMDLSRRLFPRHAIWISWFLVTMPAFVILSRIAIESLALNPFLFIAGIWCFYVLGIEKTRWVSRVGYAGSGLFFSLAIWNHIMALPSVISAILTFVIFVKHREREIVKTLFIFMIGIIMGSIPGLYDKLFLCRENYEFLPSKFTPPFLEFALNFLYTLGGDALYIRKCGEILFSLNWVLPAFLFASATILFRKDIDRSDKRKWTALAFFFVMSALGTWIITPSGMTGSRLWVLSILTVPILMALSLPEKKRQRVYISSLLVLINLSSLTLNYFYNFLEDGGIPKAAVYVGGRYDNSWDFIDMKSTIDRVRNYNLSPIVIEDFNLRRLKFLLPRSERERAFTIPLLWNPDYSFPHGTLVMLLRLENRNFSPMIRIGMYICKLKDNLSTRQYCVYEIIGKVR
jgi:4-amino-4-deoxy-L-arabinose transferase-like glycosyltransferase